ncbi:hypothetical protein [Metabacillus fastidiosus]|uniref:hypothetical protein n=1 Tax=Metabacillus fastidiosus TaxID=1458 RepID=UPI002DBAD2EE|nr:hypothetical protein [Metabacillus fastidiosus]MEC2077433.1 hypothetical protein [Metabacillus fastidiosus]
MNIVDRLKQFIIDQTVIPKSIKIHPKYIEELENSKYAYRLERRDNGEVRRFMGIELIPDEETDRFEAVEKDENDHWIVKKEVKRLKEKYIKKDNEAAKDISLLFGYIGYLERELEDKRNYLRYLKKQQ